MAYTAAIGVLFLGAAVMAQAAWPAWQVLTLILWAVVYGAMLSWDGRHD